jgi:predicted MFS family arabinose efflux permease
MRLEYLLAHGKELAYPERHDLCRLFGGVSRLSAPGSEQDRVDAKGLLRGPLWPLQAAAFLSTFDRFTIAPMLLTIAAALGVSLEEVAVAASVYFLLYGLMQPVWGMLSDRLGRVRVMRLALLVVVVPGLLSALAPNLSTLVVGRALAGGLLAAVIPSALVYIGDAVPISGRQKALADQLAASAVATAIATAAAGLAAHFDLWRLAFALPAIASAMLGIGLARQLPEPPKVPGNASALAQIGLVARRPWAILVVLLALVEGGVILGFLTYLPPSLEDAGYGAAIAGVAVGLYGLATLSWTWILKWASDGLPGYVLILIGGVLLASGYTAGALNRHLAGAALAAVLVAGGFAFMHSTLQTWATEVLPEARATVVSFFAGAVFAGSGVATAVAAPLAEAGSYTLLFTVAALTAIPLGLGGTITRLSYDRK